MENILNLKDMIVMEQWKDIPGYEGKYQASDLGNVRSLNYRRTGKCKLLKLGYNSGYLCICLHLSSGKKFFHVHQLVAMSFLGHKPEGNKTNIDHIDHNKFNNRLNNLRIVTSRENTLHGLLERKKSGLPIGVSERENLKKKYRAKININGKGKCLGYFNTPEEASTAYQKELRNHG